MFNFPALPQTLHMSLGKSLNISEPQSPSCKTGLIALPCYLDTTVKSPETEKLHREQQLWSALNQANQASPME